jgi:14-3-3 protein epsilon
MSTVNLENLSLQEEEGFVFDVEEGEEEVIDFRWCLVGRFLGDRSFHVNSMKVTMADVWRPVKGVKIKEATSGLFLFQFAHALDMEAVLQGGPWAFNNQMLIVERVQLGVQIENIPLNHVDFWVQVHNLPTGLMAERVGKTLANFIGSFVEYDKNNKGSFWREYMRIRVRVDIRQPLKKESRVKSQGGNWCTVNFKYERLGVFCFVCGLIGHGENRCAVRFSMAEDDGTRFWSKDLRAEPRRRGGRQTSRWLTEEHGDRSEQSDRSEQGENPSRDEALNHTRPSVHVAANRPNQTTIIPQSKLCPPPVPPFNSLQQQLAHTETIPSAFSLENSEITENDNNQRMILGRADTLQPALTHQPLLTLNSPDKPLIDQSLPHNSQTTSSYSLSPIINDSLKIIPSQHFSFKASIRPTFNQPTNPLTRPIKNKPNPKTIRTGPVRTGPNLDPNRPKADPNQNTTAAMETLTEKKRRRDTDKEKEEASTVTQHFLTVGPGSQACRDQ